MWSAAQTLITPKLAAKVSETVRGVLDSGDRAARARTNWTGHEAAWDEQIEGTPWWKNTESANFRGELEYVRIMLP